jgi:hypothetical protein
MKQILFISEQYIKDTSYIDENVDAKLLRNLIADTQEYKIHQVVGTALFNELKDEIDNSNVGSDNAVLLSTYIAPALKFWVLSEGALILTYKIMNKAIVKRTSENTETLQVNELDSLMNYFKERAEYFSERITKYLLANTDKYPLYLNPGNGCDTIHPNDNNFTQGLFL